MASTELTNELVETIQESQGLKHLNQAFAFAWGMASTELTDRQMQKMIDGLKKEDN